MTVYMLRNKVNGKYYVGKTVRSLAHRWNGHKHSARTGSMLPIHCAIRKYGPDNFEVNVLYHATQEQTEAKLLEFEEFFIGVFRSTDQKYGYNVTEGGKGGKGRVISERQRQQHSEAMRGRKFTEAHKHKLVSALKRRKYGPEARLNMSKAAKNRRRSAESERRRIGAFHAFCEARKEDRQGSIRQRAIISRKEAKTAGLTRYFTGVPCKRGHLDERLVSRSVCAECHRLVCRASKNRKPADSK